MKIKRIHGKELFYISTSPNLDREMIKPQVPINSLTKNKFEDWKTKRVCFYPSIDNALSGMDHQNLSGMTLYVYSPTNIRQEFLEKPGLEKSPKVMITGEYWYKEPVELRYLGSITITGKEDKELIYRYGPRQSKGVLYKWIWEENLKPWEKKGKL